MNARILICIPVHNRLAIAAQCVPTVRHGMADGDRLHLWDDGSTEVDSESRRTLEENSDFTHIGPPLGIEEQRRRHFYEFANSDCTHLLLADSDAFFDPSWRSELLRLQDKYDGIPMDAYDTEAHVRLEGNTVEDDPASEIIVRRVAPGIAYLLTNDHVDRVMAVLPSLPSYWHWDWTVPAILGHRFGVCRRSLCDHIGFGGAHHPATEGLDGGDRARNPTDRLVQKRAEIVAKLRAGGIAG